MPGAAPYLKRFARHPHAVPHQGGATATRAVRAMTVRKGIGHPADGLSPWGSEAASLVTPSELRRVCSSAQGPRPPAVFRNARRAHVATEALPSLDPRLMRVSWRRPLPPQFGRRPATEKLTGLADETYRKRHRQPEGYRRPRCKGVSCSSHRY